MKANRYRLIPDRDTERVLRLVGDRVSALWNAANYLCRRAFLDGEHVSGYSVLCEGLKEHDTYRALPSDIAQEVLKKLSEAWRSYFRLRSMWKSGELSGRPGLPNYRKDRTDGSRPWDFIPIKCERSYRVSARHIAVTLPADLRDANGGRLEVPYLGLRRYTGKGKRAELRYDAARDRWYFHHAVQVPENRQRAWRRAAAVDLGVRNLLSLSVEGESRSIHFSGREVLKDFDYWGRRIAAHQRELSHRAAGRRSSRRLRRLHARRRDRLTHAWEALSRRVAAALKLRRVGIVYIGWPKEIRCDADYGRKLNGRIHNFWSFDRVSRILAKHLRRAGIAVERVGERGTSSTCPVCGSRDVLRRPWSLLRCREQKCGAVVDSDQAGSRNILRQNKPTVEWDGAEAVPEPEVHRWNYHRWVDAPNRSSVEGLPAA